MEIKLEKLQEADAVKLYEFELENRKYFETMVPSRGDDYYKKETFRVNHELLIDEQTKGISLFYLIKDKNDLILGRMNLVDIDQSLNLGHVGYRIGKAYTGKGIANKALKLLLSTLNKEEIKHVLAKTTTNNIASQKILENNGFKNVDSSNEEFEMNGQQLKFVYYEWTI